MSRAPKGGRSQLDKAQLKIAQEGLDETRKGVRVAIWGVAITLLLGVAGLLLTLRAPGSSGSPAPPRPTPPALVLTQAWPFITGCPSTSSKVAMPVGRGSLQQFHSTDDLRSTLVDDGAGSWTYGQLYLDFAAAPSTTIEIVGIKPHVQRRNLAAPAWIYVPDDGCGPLRGDRVFKFSLDTPSLTDTGLEPAPGDSHPSDAPVAPLGPDFMVSGKDHARIRVDAYSCRGNYQWTVDIQYIVTGRAGVQTMTVGPFQSYGVADNTTVYEAQQDQTGALSVDRQSILTGTDPQSQC